MSASIEQHETAEAGALEGLCEDPDETHVDEKASQSVAATASVAARIILAEDGTLSYEVNGPNPQGADNTITLPRSSPNNVLFINESGEHRRLSADLGTMPDPEDPRRGRGRPEPGLHHPRRNRRRATHHPQHLTAQLVSPEGNFFFVPGVETARLELVVP